MTSPANARTVNGGRVYTNPCRDDDRTYDSVTRLISEGVPKHLGNWFKKVTAEWSYDNQTTWADLPRDQAVTLMKTASDRVRDAAGNIGNHVHTHLEQRALGETPPDLAFACPDAIPVGRTGRTVPRRMGTPGSTSSNTPSTPTGTATPARSTSSPTSPGSGKSSATTRHRKASTAKSDCSWRPTGTRITCSSKTPKATPLSSPSPKSTAVSSSTSGPTLIRLSL